MSIPVQSASGLKVLLCVSGGIAAYKAAEVLRDLREGGCEVTVVATNAALSFVGEATWAALSGKPVARSLWQQAHEVPHVSLARWADVIAVVPATADTLARIADGRADDLLASICLMSAAPLIMFPAMHTEMWEHPQTQHNVRELRERGVRVVTPDSGRLTGPDTGVGRLGEPASIAAVIIAFADSRLAVGPLRGRRVVVTAGGTRESVDPARVITNNSSGMMGYALAAAAVAAGADVTLISANVALPQVAGAVTTTVTSHADLSAALGSHMGSADLLLMAAAVSDYAPEASDAKIKKDADTLTLQARRLPDILAGIGAARGAAKHPVLVGFAAETAGGSELVSLAREKLGKKQCDLVVANDISAGAVFGRDRTSICIVDADTEVVLADVSKLDAAVAVVAAAAALLS